MAEYSCMADEHPLADEYADLFAPAPLPPPKGWEPFVEYAGAIGSAIVRLPRPTATKHDLLIEAGFDPEEWMIKGDVNVRKWMRYDQEWLYYYKFDVVAGEESDEQLRADIDELRAMFSRKPPKRGPAREGVDSFVLVATDYQIGKGEGGGTAATIERIRDGYQMALDYLKQLRKAGYKMPVGSLLGLGDLHEGCTGFYPMQEFQTDLDRRSQNRVVRRLLREAVEIFAPHFDNFIVAGVGGNHGEQRKEGKAFTTFADNDDVAAMEVLQEVITGRDGYDHVRFAIPDDELTLPLDLNGVSVGLAHGHQFGKGGSTAQKKAENWWAFQAFGYQPLADAQILVTGHYHHYSACTYGKRTHIQGPSLDGGSKWFKDQTGMDAPTGTLVFRTDANHPLGWDHARVLA